MAKKRERPLKNKEMAKIRGRPLKNKEMGKKRGLPLKNKSEPTQPMRGLDHLLEYQPGMENFFCNF